MMLSEQLGYVVFSGKEARCEIFFLSYVNCKIYRLTIFPASAKPVNFHVNV